MPLTRRGPRGVPASESPGRAALQPERKLKLQRQTVALSCSSHSKRALHCSRSRPQPPFSNRRKVSRMLNHKWLLALSLHQISRINKRMLQVSIIRPKQLVKMWHLTLSRTRLRPANLGAGPRRSVNAIRQRRQQVEAMQPTSSIAKIAPS